MQKLIGGGEYENYDIRVFPDRFEIWLDNPGTGYGMLAFFSASPEKTLKDQLSKHIESMRSNGYEIFTAEMRRTSGAPYLQVIIPQLKGLNA